MIDLDLDRSKKEKCPPKFPSTLNTEVAHCIKALPMIPS